MQKSTKNLIKMQNN